MDIDSIEEIEKLVIQIQNRLYDNRDRQLEASNLQSNRKQGIIYDYYSHDQALKKGKGITDEYRYGKIQWRLRWIRDAVGRESYGRKD